MSRRWSMSPKYLLLLLSVLSVALWVACGSSSTTAPESAAEPTPTSAAAPAGDETPDTQVPQPGATDVPVAVPTPTEEASAMVAPTGELNVSFSELGPHTSHPRLTGYPQFALVQLAAYEGLVGRDANGQFFGKLAKSWSIAEDNLTWTFELQEGVEWHKGWGEMTADDVIWSIEQTAAEGSISGAAGQIRRIWQHEDGSLRAIDDYTVEVNTGQPAFDMLTYINAPSAGGSWISSKKQSDGEGEDQANRLGAGTGPWEIIDHRTNDFWKYDAVPDHWRKTPEFAEMTFFEIPEESTRVANFLAGKIDVFSIGLDSIPAVEDLEGIKWMSQENGSESHLGFYGSWYTGVGTDEERAGWDPDAPYVSANPDINSPEWENAKKVRRAIGMAIDRDKLIKELLRGEGRPLPLWGWAAFPDLLEADMKWEYDPDQARKLLAEAGYEDGFSMELTPSIRGAPMEVEACEAVAAMLEDVGIRARLQRIPFTTLSEGQFARTNTGVTCHAAQPLSEPLVLQNFVLINTANWTGGTDHPVSNEIINRANAIFDKDERAKETEKLARFMWDESLDVGLYSVNVVYALSAKVDPWTEHLETGDARRISSLEYAPRRRE